MADCTQDFRDIRSTLCSYTVSDLKSRRSAVLEGIRGKDYRAVGQPLVAPGCPEKFSAGSERVALGLSTRDEFQAHLSFSDSVDLTRCSGVGPKLSHVGGGASRGTSC
jgi:hypothetical protein